MPTKSHALNLFTDDNSKSFKIAPLATKTVISCDTPIEVTSALKLGAHVDLAATVTALQQDVLTNASTAGTASNTVQANLVSEAARIDQRIDNIIDAGNTLDQVSEVVAAFNAADASVMAVVANLQSQLSTLQAQFAELTAP